MILLWGLPEDPPMRAVQRELQAANANHLFIDQGWTDQVKMDDAGDRLTFNGRSPGRNDITAMYPRPYDATAIPGLDMNPTVARHVDHVESALLEWASSVDAIVVNRPLSPHLNHSKPAQLHRIASLTSDLQLPPTLVTTCPDAFETFVASRERCIVKSVSGHRSRVRSVSQPDLDPDRLASVRFCPVQVQEWIPGTDVRVHIVGDQVFPTEVGSEADDYRYEQASLTATTIPDRVADACRQVMSGMGLHLAGVDLRRTPAGEWFCFEVNPSPAFTYYQSRTGQPIARAIADLLRSGARGEDGRCSGATRPAKCAVAG